jgi:hypothetical protein
MAYTDTNKKQIDRVYSKIDKLAKKGRDQIFEYIKLIDDLINKGNYGYFEQCLNIYYGIDTIKKYNNVIDIKANTWSLILFKTQNRFAVNLKSLYDSKGVYQVGLDFYTSIGLSASIHIGQIQQITKYNQDIKYLIENREFARLTGATITYLIAYKDGYATASIFNATYSTTPEQTLLDNYSAAIDFLLI